MKKQELELERFRGSRGNNETNSKALRPKLPKLDKKQDDIHAYSEQFEKFAQSQNWSEETLTVSHSSLLTGRGLEVTRACSSQRHVVIKP